MTNSHWCLFFFTSSILSWKHGRGRTTLTSLPTPLCLSASDGRKRRWKCAQTPGWQLKHPQPSHLMAHVFGISGARAFADSSGGVSHEYAKSSSCQVARSWSGRRSRTAQPGVVAEIWAFSARRASFIFHATTGARQLGRTGVFPVICSKIKALRFLGVLIPHNLKRKNVPSHCLFVNAKLLSPVILFNDIIQFRLWILVLQTRLSCLSSRDAHTYVWASRPKCLQSFLAALLHGECESCPGNKEERKWLWTGP